MTIPYQVYTYSKTGQILFFSNVSGETLYWMSTPYAGEMGDWNNSDFTANCVEESTGFFASSREIFSCNKKLFRNFVLGL